MWHPHGQQWMESMMISNHINWGTINDHIADHILGEIRRDPNVNMWPHNLTSWNWWISTLYVHMSILLGRSIWQKGLNLWTRGLPSVSICFAPPNWHRPCQIGGLEDYLPLKHVHVQGLCYLLYYGGFLKWGYPKVYFFQKITRSSMTWMIWG